MTAWSAFWINVAVGVAALWLIGEYVRTNWGRILRWNASRLARRNYNPYRAGFHNGFWYGLFVGAGLISLAWRIWR